MSSELFELNQDVIIFCFCDGLGWFVYKVQLICIDNQSEKVVLIWQIVFLLVIFILGIMGINLCNKVDKSEVWRLLNGLWFMDDLFVFIGVLWIWVWRGLKVCQEFLKVE